MRGGYVYKSKLKGRRSLCIAALFQQNDAFTKVNLYGLKNRLKLFCIFAKIVGLIDEISIKRIHIEEKIRGHFYLFAYGVNDLSNLVVLIIFETINVLMTVDASCRLLLLFLSGPWQESICFEELFDSLSCAALDIF